MHASNNYHRGYYVLPTVTELQKLDKYLDNWSRNAGGAGLGLCYFEYFDNEAYREHNVPICHSAYCLGAAEGDCRPAALHSSEYGKYFHWHNSATHGIGTSAVDKANRVRCVRSLNRYNRFSGSGGASGAQLNYTISVLPKDTLVFTIGSGGEAGIYNTNKNNGKLSRQGNGGQGGTTQVVHKRGASVLGTYYVKGGYGGYGATTTAHGETTSSTTPLGTCYANGNVSCSIDSFFGVAGSSLKGGNGGRINNTGNILDGQGSSGGYLFIDGSRAYNQRATEIEIRLAKGQHGSIVGYGGGGGFTPNWVDSSAYFSQGGSGARGQVDITYDVITPGGGGGSGASADEIEYKITPGTRLIFTIGKAGSGGVASQKGANGTATTIMENEIILNGGQGGTFGAGGAGGVLKINTSKAKKLNAGDGIKGDNGNNAVNFGFDGGSGATTFLGYFGGCGAGIITDDNLNRACQTSTIKDGIEARNHNAVKNQYGGSGGGGGGIITTNSELGRGGDGADGYLRIRWGDE